MCKIQYFFVALFCLCCTVTTVSGQSLTEPDTDLLLGKKELLKSPKYTLLPEVADAFNKMESAALNDGIVLKVVSSFRSYTAQRKIWNRKYKRYIKEGLSPTKAIEKIVTYSTLPGTSRHHWGTDIDLIDATPKVDGDVLLDSLFLQGPYQKLHKWLSQNSEKFGFYLVYTPDSSRTGFFYEPWHFSYRKLALPYLAIYKEKMLLDSIAKDSLLLGNSFISERFKTRYLRDHILGINPQLLPQ